MVQKFKILRMHTIESLFLFLLSAPFDAQLCRSAEPHKENTNTGSNATIAAIQKTNVHSATEPCETIKFERT